MKILVTGSNGFLAKNLIVQLNEKKYEIITFSRENKLEELEDKIIQADFIYHLAGVNRPKEESEFTKGNFELTKSLCEILKKQSKKIPVVFSSSVQADLQNPYGKSKLEAEEALKDLNREHGNEIYVFRLPNVFGKWCRHNYNSAVATFCYNTVNDLPISINDPMAIVRLVYVDDVVTHFISLLNGNKSNEISPVYEITVGQLAEQIKNFKESRVHGVIERVGSGFVRALYSTYISYFRPQDFKYPLIKHEDTRGLFVEMLKTQDSGQFSFFTAHPGVTRGSHYHHTKTEKFLIVQGEARFCFRHVITNEKFELIVNGNNPEIVETIPGWVHDITNIGDSELIVLIWANEIFNKERPDTIAGQV